MGNNESQPKSFITQKTQKLVQTAKSGGKPASKRKSKGYIAIEDESASNLDKLDLAARVANPADFVFPFENLVFSGGGLNCMAYCGCLEYLQVAGCLDSIKRISGTNYGALVGLLCCVGFNWQEISTILSNDIASLVKGGAFCNLLPDVIRGYGISSIGEDIYNRLGKLLNDKIGDADITFKQLYINYGKELCVIVTNLNQMKIDYFHIKTTPDIPVRAAVQMALTIPGIYTPRIVNKERQECIYIDGGLLNNYPIRSFDGSYLCLNQENNSRLPTLIGQNETTNDKACDRTLGVLLYTDAEDNCMKTKLESRLGVLIPPKPCTGTTLFKRNYAMIQKSGDLEKDFFKTKTVAENFIKILEKLPMDILDKKDLKDTFSTNVFPQEDVDTLFGEKSDIKTIFENLDHERKGLVSRQELISKVHEKMENIRDEHNITLQKHVHNFSTFMLALEATVRNSVSKQQIMESDVERTVGINSGYIDGDDKDLTEADKQFLIERGYNSTRAFLQYYVAQHKPHKKLTSQKTVDGDS
ncbi:hypothetical protein LOTGIDRAFT_239305 [Lottia gigantea]|uniref:PNPLA domain-containing protein n=1 Tax=Lottia gigantea TaxID=225164 RepID=V4AP82_LOTGI|nr:hypothetical protein LOTGIDRAFT_239305 [Lottia gigantea]ESO96600.1 hypothetical protein LOTGIDRAFT_239305 [Lottia gigantea]